MSSPKFSWPVDPEQYASSPVPSLQDWEGLWKAWDTVTRGMVPQEELHAKPIKLRNACIFYLGHIPTFLDIHLTRATGVESTGPSYYPTIFERGIDPDVDNPELCHAHSEIPDSWPPFDEILDFQECVRSRVRMVIESGQAKADRKVARAMWIGFEHEIMHLETFLYMLLQSDKTLSPTGMEIPDFETMAIKAREQAIENEWFIIPDHEIQVGLDDPENDLGPDRYFGWDNERPARRVKVPSFVAQARPISNGDYAKFLEENQIQKIPASWSQDWICRNGTGSTHRQNGKADGYANGHSTGKVTRNDTVNASDSYLAGKSVRTAYGLIPLKFTLDWPVFASYDDLASFAKWMDARIPTADEVRSIYSYVNQTKERDTENVIGKTISAVNG
jgi:L-histidine Nalpha-methyltransferase / hercynylcysteine S-oxide synthase